MHCILVGIRSNIVCLVHTLDDSTPRNFATSLPLVIIIYHRLLMSEDNKYNQT